MYFTKKSSFINLINKYTKPINIIYAFRYLSLFITCIFFLLFSTHEPFKKLLIIIFITAATILLNILYFNCKDNKLHTIVILIAETVCISVIIILSDGYRSPFIWYIFNTILFSLVLLNNRLISYMCLAVYIMAIFIADIYKHYPYSKIIIEPIEYNTTLCLILITILIQALVKKYFGIINKNTELNRKNQEINAANQQQKKSMQYIMDLYNTVHVFAIQNKKEDIINQIINYSSSTLQSRCVCFIENVMENSNHKVYNCANQHISREIDTYINLNYISICTNSTITSVEINEIIYSIYPVKYECTVYGLLVIELDSNKSIERDSIIFISELSAILFNKFELEEINNKFIISGEQNRIADEIHDGVLQRMFNISCSIFNLSKKLEDHSDEQVSYELNAINDSLSKAMKDLRKTIYKLSVNKDGSNVFIGDIKDYIKEVGNLNNVKIYFELFGDSELLNITCKKAIYRIICESISNSIRHGNSKDIYLTIDVTNTNVALTIKDNGIGFEYTEIMNKQKHGLGLLNIQHLINSLNGELVISSMIDKGTSICITLPL